MFQSIIEARGEVAFPEHTGERVYMERFYQSVGLPEHLSRWQATIDQMLVGIDTDLPIYLMVDQTRVLSGATQRRPGLHVDGYWCDGEISSHGGGPGVPAYPPAHRMIPRHGGEPYRGPGCAWLNIDFSTPEAIILASSVSAAQGHIGTYDGVIGAGGDCAAINTDYLDVMPMLAHRVYAGNVCNLHGSLPVDRDCDRTLVRLNVPGWTPRS